MPDTQEDSIIAEADRAAEILAKQAIPDIRPEVNAQREAELDEAFAAALKKPAPAKGEPGSPGFDLNGNPLPGAPEPEKDEVETAPTKPAEEPKVEEKKDAPPADTGKGLLEDLLATPKKDTPPAPAAEDPYGQVKLRSDASPKTKESFEALKRVATEREQAERSKLEELRKQFDAQRAEIEELKKRTVPDEVQNELKELRAFRAQFDTQNDPEFKQKFESRITTNYNAVYSKLAEHGLPEAEITKLKSFDARARDSAIENFLSKLPSFDRKYIEAKLLDNVNVGDERDRALQEARANADKILAERKQAPVVQTAQRDAAVAEVLRPVLPKLAWLHVKEVPPAAAPEEKKRIESENQFAISMQEALKSAIIDDSPKQRAEAAIAVPLAQFYRREHAAASARADALQKQLDEIRQAGALSRTARSVANAGKPPVQQKAVPADASEALDSLFTEITSARR